MTTRYARISAGTAIAAALALSSTGGFAQEAPPTTSTESTPAASSTPAPAVDAAPVTTDTTAPAPVEMDTSAPAPAAKKTVRHTTHVATATAKPVVTHTTARTVSEHASVPAVAPAPVATVTPTTSKVQPVVDMNAKTSSAAPAPAKHASKPDETAMIAGGGALALLILGGGAYGLTRRRADEEIWDEQADDVDEPGTMGRHDPVFDHEPAMIAPSAFAWGDEQPGDPQVAGSSDDRQPGESWVERAYRGPSAENPSLSLRKRLKRAAFFDKREREVAAGEAAPIEADAGLPESVAEATPQRELEAA